MLPPCPQSGATSTIALRCFERGLVIRLVHAHMSHDMHMGTGMGMGMDSVKLGFRGSRRLLDLQAARVGFRQVNTRTASTTARYEGYVKRSGCQMSLGCAES
uniref:Uncharacterized protein n=1 Tax=Haptolina brevifila TaxID=156173 RepID=A0A7S2NCQ6_9EUKA